MTPETLAEAPEIVRVEELGLMVGDIIAFRFGDGPWVEHKVVEIFGDNAGQPNFVGFSWACEMYKGGRYVVGMGVHVELPAAEVKIISHAKPLT